jgi:formylglycine-generating enzyme required for sulfatase activity
MRSSIIRISLALAFSAASFGAAAGADQTAAPKANDSSPAKELALDLGGGVKLQFVLIPAGEFLMGSADSDPQGENNEKPQHRVRITKPFYLGKYKVMQDQWDALMGSNSSAFRGPQYPVNAVSWDDCQTYIKKLDDKFPPHRGKFRLPTEAQWEYACRAGGTTEWSFGDDVSKLGDYAWCRTNAEESIHPLGQKKPNAWGLYDMHGDLWEWCADSYDRRYYASSPAVDPAGPSPNGYRVLRGGSWNLGPEYARSARRSWLGQNVGSFLHGFRLAMGL